MHFIFGNGLIVSIEEYGYILEVKGITYSNQLSEYMPKEMYTSLFGRTRAI